MVASLVAWVAADAFAATLRVPAEYPTIQSAIDAMSERDTIVVDTGVYAEALIAPPLSFSLFGTEDSTSGRVTGTVVDPSSLENPTGLTCLQVSGDSVVIDRMTFRNGAAMYPREPDVSGGIQHAARVLDLRNCVFDSTHRSVQGFGERRTVLAACQFRYSSGACVLTQLGVVEAYDCIFQSDSADWGLVMSRGSSRFERCHFTGYHWFGWDIMFQGETLVVRDCLFGPSGPSLLATISLRAHNVIIEGNEFVNIRRGTVVVIEARCPGEIVVRDNHFHRVGPLPAGGGLCMSALVNFEQDTCREFSTAVVSDNRLTDCTAQLTFKAIVYAGRGMEIVHNEFRDLSPREWPAIGFGLGWGTIRDNFIQNTGLAVRMDSTLDGEADAAFNWWGDSTGPYHPVLNPDGLGDEVSDRVIFEPWHTDTSFFADVPERTPAGVASNALQVFPNPFNATATLRLTVPAPQIVRIELFDLLGRRVREIFVGPVAYQREFSLDADALASGIYFARAQNTITRQTLAITKLALVK